ncbi:MAG: hypothetical protein ACRCSB_04275 [Bacteroidales bacterium]
MKKLFFTSLMLCILALTACLPDYSDIQYPVISIGTVRRISPDDTVRSSWYIELDNAKKIWISNTAKFTSQPVANLRIFFIFLLLEEQKQGYDLVGELTEFSAVEVVPLLPEHKDIIAMTQHGGVYQVNAVGTSGGQYLNIDVTLFYKTDFTKHAVKVLCDTTSKDLPLLLHFIHQENEDVDGTNHTRRIISIDLEKLKNITNTDSISLKLTTKYNMSSSEIYTSPVPIGYRFK